MEIFAPLVFSIIFLTMCLGELRDPKKYPSSEIWKKKYRVKDNSFLRKFLRFKDYYNLPCNYFNAIPAFISICFCLFCIIIVVIDFAGNKIITKTIPKIALVLFPASVYVLYGIYLAVLSIWFYFVDRKTDIKRKKELYKTIRKDNKTENKKNKK